MSTLLLLRDRIALIRSHCSSLERTEAKNDLDGLKRYFEYIKILATEGEEIYNTMASADGSTTAP